jgi:hypothetical protein
MTTDPTTDRPRALHLLEAADFLRDAHFRDGLSVQEAITALRHMADEADPMVGSLARDGFGLDEIAAMPAAPVAAPPTGQAGLRDRIAGVLRPHANLGGVPPRYELPLFGGATPSLPRISGWWALDDVVAAVMASCPGYEMSPSPCRCPCYGCKHHCGAHDPGRMADEEQQARPLGCGCPDEDATEHSFGTADCTCIPFTRQTDPPRYLNRPTDTVDMISGWEPGGDCPHHVPAREETGSALARYIVDQPVSVVQAALRILGWPPLRLKVVDVPTTPPAVVAEPGKENGRG